MNAPPNFDPDFLSKLGAGVSDFSKMMRVAVKPKPLTPGELKALQNRSEIQLVSGMQNGASMHSAAVLLQENIATYPAHLVSAGFLAVCDCELKISAFLRR